MQISGEEITGKDLKLIGHITIGKGDSEQKVPVYQDTILARFLAMTSQRREHGEKKSKSD